MDALTFLDKAAKSKRQPVYALVGDEDFLKGRCREAIQSLVLGDADPAFALSVYPGENLEISTVRNDLETLPFLSPARLVVVEAADPFVTEHREALERYVAKPSSIGVLVLEVKTIPETTKLAKALPDGAKLVCKAPSADRLKGWCVSWCKSRYQKTIPFDAAEYLVELVGPSMGLLDQELAKLAAATGTTTTISGADVETYVGRSRGANVFQILSAIGDGRPAQAFKILGELFEEGEDPHAVLGALTSQLRKLAAVEWGLKDNGGSLGPAMNQAGIPAWPQARQSAERQLKHLGRRRLAELPQMLVDINLGLKGGNPLPNRLQVERLLAKLGRPRAS
jgi:DNA polymerase-3 subunit delta